MLYDQENNALHCTINKAKVGLATRCGNSKDQIGLELPPSSRVTRPPEPCQNHEATRVPWLCPAVRAAHGDGQLSPVPTFRRGPWCPRLQPSLSLLHFHPNTQCFCPPLPSIPAFQGFSSRMEMAAHPRDELVAAIDAVQKSTQPDVVIYSTL